MPTSRLVAVVLGSVIVTLDGTAVTVALADIGRDFHTRFSVLQWITNASLLMLAALVIPAGALGDRYGRRRVMLIGLLLFGAASAACASATEAGWLIALRFVQGGGAALIVPAAVAILRASYYDQVERTRAFGLAAGCSGLAGAVGPVLGGGLVDAWSWRAVFIASALLAVPALLLVTFVPESRTEDRESPSVGGTLLVIVVLGSLSYGLIESANGEWRSKLILTAFACGGALLLCRHARLATVIPREIVRASNCIVANAVTAALYFGLFGMSFLLVTYTQAVLEYSATWAGASLLPVALMMLFCDRFGQLAAKHGSRLFITSGVSSAGVGVLWLAAGQDPLPFWSHIVPGTTVFGMGLALAVGPLTHAAVSSLPVKDAGAASGVHHATVRAAGLVAVASLGTIAGGGRETSGLTLEGFRTALVVCGAVILLAGVLIGRFINDDLPGGLAKGPDADDSRSAAHTDRSRAPDCSCGRVAGCSLFLNVRAEP